jgi:hypothetical protein
MKQVPLKSAVLHTLYEEQLYPLRVKRIKGSQPGNSNLHLKFCRWFLHKIIHESDFLYHVLFTDDTTFTGNRVNSHHNVNGHCCLTLLFHKVVGLESQTVM